MQKQFKEIFLDIQKLFGDTIIAIKEGMVAAHSAPISDIDAVDNVFALREAEKYCEALLKEVRKVHRTAQYQACIKCMSDGKDGMHGDYAAGKPKINKMFKLPHKRRKDPEAYDKVMMDLGIPEDVMLRELLRFNWPEVQKYYNETLAEGKNAPISMADTESEYTFVVRKTGKEIK